MWDFWSQHKISGGKKILILYLLNFSRMWLSNMVCKRSKTSYVVTNFTPNISALNS